jgi:hypothetical protein
MPDILLKIILRYLPTNKSFNVEYCIGLRGVGVECVFRTVSDPAIRNIIIN